MKPSEYLDKCKIALKIESDYGLGKALAIPNQRIADYYKGKAIPDAYACAKIALTLRMEPLAVLADIEEQHAKTEEKRQFWAGFPWRSGKHTGLILWALVFGSSYMIGSPVGSTDASSHNVRFRQKRKSENQKQTRIFPGFFRSLTKATAEKWTAAGSSMTATGGQNTEKTDRQRYQPTPGDAITAFLEGRFFRKTGKTTGCSHLAR